MAQQHPAVPYQQPMAGSQDLGIPADGSRGRFDNGPVNTNPGQFISDNQQQRAFYAPPTQGAQQQICNQSMPYQRATSPSMYGPPQGTVIAFSKPPDGLSPMNVNHVPHPSSLSSSVNQASYGNFSGQQPIQPTFNGVQGKSTPINSPHEHSAAATPSGVFAPAPLASQQQWTQAVRQQGGRMPSGFAPPQPVAGFQRMPEQQLHPTFPAVGSQPGQPIGLSTSFNSSVGGGPPPQRPQPSMFMPSQSQTNAGPAPNLNSSGPPPTMLQPGIQPPNLNSSWPPPGGLARPPPPIMGMGGSGPRPPPPPGQLGAMTGQLPPPQSFAPRGVPHPGASPQRRPPPTGTQFGPPLASGASQLAQPPSVRIQGPPLDPGIQNNTMGGNIATRPTELPMPYDGAGLMSHQVIQRGGSSLTQLATPGSTGGSEPHSQRSSRASSPLGQTPDYDSLEGGSLESSALPQQSPQGLGYTSSAQPHQPPASMSYVTSPTTSYGGPPTIGGYGMPSQPGSAFASQAGPFSSAGTGYQPMRPERDAAGVSRPPAFPSPASGQHHVQPHPAVGGAYQANLSTSFNRMEIQPDYSRPLNLLTERNILPTTEVEQVVPNLPHEYKKANCSPDVMCCTLNAIPTTQSLLNKSRLPLGVLLHPFKDLALPVIQSSVIVRCRSCRTYINPFVSFVDARRWKCNLCFRVNELPDEFNYDPVSKTYGEPQRRPEIRSCTIEFIAPSEYMLRPPQPAVYLYLLDVSFNAVETGYLSVFCETLLKDLDRVPGDSRAQIGFLAYDSSLYFFGLNDDTSQPHVFVVPDLDEVFYPCPDDLLVNIHDSRAKIVDLLTRLPALFEHNLDTGSALGPALLTAHKLMSFTGGRITVIQTQMPNIGAGALKCREDPNERAGKVVNLTPATDFYKKLSLDCSAQQIAVDVFMLNTQYADIASIACVSKYSGGAVHYFPGFHTATNPGETDRFEAMLRRYFTRKIGFEAVMRIRCTKSLSIHTFHGNSFVRSTDVLSLPNISPEAGFGMQLSIDDTIESNYVCFQAALLYTSSKAERRIRVHTLCIPVTTQLSDVHACANQRAIVGLLTKMAVDKSVTASLSDAREAMINSAVDMMMAYGSSLTSGQRLGQLPCPYQLRLIPLYILAMLKFSAFRVGTSTKLDDRVFALEQCKNLPLTYLMQQIHADLYPVHSLDDKNAIVKEEVVIAQPPRLPLSAAHIDRHGAYIMDNGEHLYFWIGASISDQFCHDVLDVQCFQHVVDGLTELPKLDNPTSDRLRTFIQHLNDQKPVPAQLLLIREDSRNRSTFIERLIEDRTESSFSYVEFLQHIQKELKT